MVSFQASAETRGPWSARVHVACFLLPVAWLAHLREPVLYRYLMNIDFLCVCPRPLCTLTSAGGYHAVCISLMGCSICFSVFKTMC